ncbi:coiled-coil domain-containing protein 137 isoform X2 [Narcine bancroftii]|uniref:coiled-coil domain-containing protein 137 isoform X2 n=1 Tax=Narcine bancroftii TaxID=1343680 RepID=UPI003831B656
MGKLEAVKPASLGPKNKRQRKQKSNMKPKNIDEQEIPFKLREIMRSKDEIKKPKRNRKTGPKRKFVSGASGPHGQIQALKFKRKKQESVQNYIQRIEQETNYVMFLSKHQLPRCPEMEDKKKEKESCMKSTPEKKKESDKRLRRLAHKKIERKKMQLEKERFTDTVKFGEVVMQPPTLTAKPRKSQTTNKPGQRQLLLKSLIGDSKCGSERRNETSLDVNLSNVSMARQRIMLEERERVIKAYRALKKQKVQILTQN